MSPSPIGQTSAPGTAAPDEPPESPTPDSAPDGLEPDGLQKLLTDRSVYDAIVGGKDVEAIVEGWQAELDAFRAVRSKYLNYE